MLVKVRVPPCHINPNAFYEDLLADDIREVCTPVSQKDAPRNRLRTQLGRIIRRLRVLRCRGRRNPIAPAGWV